MPRQRREHLLRIDRLRNVIVHARFEAAVAVPVERVGRQRDDRHRRKAFAPADGSGRLETVHDGHVHIHQDGIETPVVENAQRLDPVSCRRDLHPHGFEQVMDHFLVDRIVLDQQNVAAGETFP